MFDRLVGSRPVPLAHLVDFEFPFGGIHELVEREAQTPGSIEHEQKTICDLDRIEGLLRLARFFFQMLEWPDRAAFGIGPKGGLRPFGQGVPETLYAWCPGLRLGYLP